MKEKRRNRWRTESLAHAKAK